MNLQELIRDNRGDRSFADLEKASGVSRQRWQQLATGNFKGFPEPDTIRAMAQVLQVSIASIVFAAAESLDLPMPPRSPRLDALPDGIDNLSSVEWAALRVLVGSVVTGKRKAGSLAPIPQPLLPGMEDPEDPAIPFEELAAARKTPPTTKRKREADEQHAE